MAKSPTYKGIVFRTKVQARRDRLSALLASKELRPAFDDKFFEMVTNRWFTLEKRSVALLALQAPILLSLGLSLASVKVGFGPFAELANKREILILVSVSLSVFSSVNARDKRALQELIEARIQNLAGKHADAVAFLKSGFGISHPADTDPDDPHLRRSFVHKLFTGIWVIVQLAFAIVLVIAALAVHFGILVDIYLHPTISLNFSRGVIGFSLLVDLLLLLNWYAERGVFPYLTDEWDILFRNLKKSWPEIYESVHQLADVKYRARGPFLRLITRPNPVRVVRKVFGKSDKPKKST
jgi:hypothetical protein